MATSRYSCSGFSRLPPLRAGPSATSGAKRNCDEDAGNRERRGEEGHSRLAGFHWCDLAELLAEADVVSLRSPVLQQTRGIINAAFLFKNEASQFSNKYFA
jgi:hypothetical protein